MCDLSHINLTSMVQFQKKYIKMKLDNALQEDLSDHAIWEMSR
jgi:hypothetical protein